jgi:transposase
MLPLIEDMLWETIGDGHPLHILILYLPTCSPELNSIELVFHMQAKLAVEANNGYTPLQWALRLSNEAVAEDLKNLTKNLMDQAG